MDVHEQENLLLLYYIDVAISAPFSETGSSDPGTVYIYHSTPSLLLTNEPQQVGIMFRM